jgi:hypothetical protein
MISYRKALFFIHCCIGAVGLYAPLAMAEEAKVDVCHIPPGNPGNAHTITIGESAVAAHLDHGDVLGPCGSARSDSGMSSACTCPRAGVWTVKNLDGWMECNVLGIKRKLKGAGKNDGAIWILNDDCSTIFSEAYEKEREDVIMNRGRDCLYFGVAPGKEQGAEVIFDGAYKIETAEFITGEYYMEMSSMGADCSGYRPFEIEFQKPLSEKDHAVLVRKMQKQLDQARKKLDDHREQIDAYLEKSEGGKALGGLKGTR